MNEEVAEARYFIGAETLAARHIMRLIEGRGETGAEKIIAWLVHGGLEGNPKAVTIMRHAYRRFLLAHEPPTADEVVDRYLEFYVMLGRLFKKGGVEV